jgi:hypothetical protein
MVAPGSPAAAATPFRAAEKAYQLHREELTRSGGGGAYRGSDESASTAPSAAVPRRRGRGRFRVRPLDLSAVLDVGALAEEEEAAQRRSDAPSAPPPPPHGGARRGASRVAVSPAVAAPVYALDGHPGFFVVVGALSAAEQVRAPPAHMRAVLSPPRPLTVSALALAPARLTRTAGCTPTSQARWAALCLGECAEPPATTNHSAALGDVAGASQTRDCGSGCGAACALPVLTRSTHTPACAPQGCGVPRAAAGCCAPTATQAALPLLPPPMMTKLRRRRAVAG